jgi:glycosyltransferase involved in cell wall biosynthesis
MKVCMVTYSIYETDTRVMQYAHALADRGDQVDVISLRLPQQSRSGRDGSIRVLRIQQRSYTEKRAVDFLTRILWFFVKATCLLAWRATRSHYDVVHVHSVPDFLVFVARLQRLRGARIILDIHDLLPELYASKFNLSGRSVLFRLLLAVERMSCRFADHVIVANDLWLDRVATRVPLCGNVSAFLNYPEKSLFAPRKRERASDKLLVIYPGSLNYHQGLDIAVRAFARIVAEVPEAEFHIYGDGGAKASLQQLTAQLALESRVRFFGRVPVHEIADIMATADLAVVPKRADGFGDEAFSTKTLQFMSLGVPVIVAATTIDRHYFNDEVVKFFHPGNETELSAAILELLRDPQRRQAMADRALAFVQRFNWEDRQAQYIEIVSASSSACEEFMVAIDPACKRREHRP